VQILVLTAQEQGTTKDYVDQRVNTDVNFSFLSFTTDFEEALLRLTDCMTGMSGH